MTRNNQRQDDLQSSRRSVLKAGSVATAASILGVSGTAAAQNQSDNGDTNPGMSAWMFNDEVHAGAIFRVSSPPLSEAPDPQGDATTFLGNATAHIVEYFNTGQEAVIYLSEDVQVEEGTLYELSETFQIVENAVEGLVEIPFHRLDNQDFPFDLEDEDIEIHIDSGGEGAIRPRNFSPSSIFYITSGQEGWVPDDVADSGIFTDYNTRHARYVGTDDKFLFFPQEGAEVETDALYTIQNEFEFFDPDGNLIAVEFHRVNEESIPISAEFF